MAVAIKLFVLLLVGLCSNAERRQRVIRGEEARPHEFKSIVSIQARHNGGFQHNCAGTLIDSRTVLTAAHCQKKNAQMRVVAGAHSQSRIATTQAIQIVNVAEQKPHKGFDWDFASNDVMILKLAAAVREGPTIQYVRLPTQEGPYPPASHSCTLAGWGLTSSSSGGSDILRKGPMTAVDVTPPDTDAGRRKDKSILYARPGGPKKSSGCAGDSGGPLYCPANDGGEPFQVGVMSGGEGICGPKDKFARFARISYLLGWINANK